MQLPKILPPAAGQAPKRGVAAAPLDNESGHRVILASFEWQPTTRWDITMADDRMGLLKRLRNAGAAGAPTRSIGG